MAAECVLNAAHVLNLIRAEGTYAACDKVAKRALCPVTDPVDRHLCAYRLLTMRQKRDNQDALDDVVGGMYLAGEGVIRATEKPRRLLGRKRAVNTAASRVRAFRLRRARELAISNPS